MVRRSHMILGSCRLAFSLSFEIYVVSTSVSLVKFARFYVSGTMIEIRLYFL